MPETNFSVDGGWENNAFLLRTNEPVVFPYSLASINVESEQELNIAAIDGAMKSDRLLAVFNEIPPAGELELLQIKGAFPHFNDGGIERCAVGTLVRIIKKLQMPDGSCRLAVRGLKRITGVSLLSNAAKQPIIRYRVMPESGMGDSVLIGGRVKELQQLYIELFMLTHGADDDMLKFSDVMSAVRLGDMIADAIPLAYPEKLMLLVMPDVERRLETIAVLLNRELEHTRMGMKLQTLVQESVGASQREFFLREQLRIIQGELGEFTGNADIRHIMEKMETLNLPEKVEKTIQEETQRLEMLPTNSPEYHINYNYIDTLLDIPWLVYSEDSLNCKNAEKILDSDHFGLEDVKKRILEFLAVMQRRHDQDDICRAPILCLVGPPGVGKTSIGKSIARAMNRKFIRVSFGGVRDEAEIRGHRRTYIGAMPGRIIQNLKRAGTANPVFMLDEVDKLAHDFRGDPAAALLEVLDPEQNNAFNDNFVELDVDLSKVFFIATANVLDDIPGPLRDRMEIIQLSGYTALEKKEIAKRYLIPRQLKENGLLNCHISFRTTGINEIISGYTMEAGVRELDRVVARVCRRIAMKFTSGEWDENAPVTVDKKMVNALLGARKFLQDLAPVPVPGCATGMAWTSVGGVILPVETLALPGGKGNLKLTGSLGKVMLESAEAAFSYIRSNPPEGIDAEFFNTHDFHIHVPDGATPKDGPSAGITMALALRSLLLKKPLIPRLAMTGEITLQGKVTAIGGVREKLVGAIRSGINKVIVPQENAKDVAELPENIRSAVEICFVSNFAEAVKIAFGQ